MTGNSGQVDNAATTSGGTGSTVVDVGDVPADTSSRIRLRSVVIATPGFKIPRRATNDEHTDDRGMDYIGPLNGPSVGCRIPTVQPEGNPYMDAYTRNWQRMKGRPRRPHSARPVKPGATSLLSPEAFLLRHGRQSLTMYRGRAHSAERLSLSSRPELMRPTGEGEVLQSSSAAPPAVARKTGLTGEDIRRLNERLLQMAGLEPRWNTEPDAVMALRRSASVPDLIEEAEHPAIEIGMELEEIARGRRASVERKQKERAQANETELLKLAAVLAQGSSRGPSGPERGNSTGATSTSAPRLPLPPLLASEPLTVQQTWAELQIERESRSKGAVFTGTISKGRRGRAGRNEDDSSPAEADPTCPEASVLSASKDTVDTNSVQKSSAANTGSAETEQPEEVNDSSDPDRGNADTMKAVAAESQKLRSEDKSKEGEGERPNPKVRSPGVTFVTTNISAKGSALDEIRSDESEIEESARTAKNVGNKTGGSPPLITARLTVNLGSPVRVGSVGLPDSRVAPRSVASASAAKKVPISPSKPATKETPVPSTTSSRKSAPTGKPSSTKAKPTTPQTPIPPPPKPTTPSPASHRQTPTSNTPSPSRPATNTTHKSKVSKQATHASASATGGSSEEPATQRGILKELERELKLLEARDVELTVDVRASRAAVQEHQAALATAEARHATSSANRDRVRKRKHELQNVIKEFQSVAQKAADLLKKKHDD